MRRVGAEGMDVGSLDVDSVTPAAGLAFLTATMLFVPCAATLAVMRQETGQWRWVLVSVGLMLFVALSPPESPIRQAAVLA